MVNRLLQPQEIEVFYVIPAIRREFALLMKGSGKPQKDIAKLLGVTEAAVSQYISSKRAANLDISENIRAHLKESAARIDGTISATRELQHILRIVRDERLICKMHEKLGNVPKGCNVCFEPTIQPLMQPLI